MATRRRVLKYGAESRGDLMKRLLKRSRLLKKNPKIVVGRLSEAEFMEKLATMKKEGEKEEREKTEKPALRGGTEEVEKHAIVPVPRPERGFLRENVSNNIRRYKKEREVVNKHK